MSKAVTRGNGEIGEVVTSNAKTFKNLPVEIPFKGRLVLRGEAFITYSSFEKINHMIEDVESKYKNPRNLCSGSVRQLNSELPQGAESASMPLHWLRQRVSTSETQGRRSLTGLMKRVLIQYSERRLMQAA